MVARLYTLRTGLETKSDNLRIKFEMPTDKVWSEPMERVLEELATPLGSDTIAQIVASFPRARYSKFQPHLPPDLEARFVASRLLDLEGAITLASEDLAVLTC